MYKQRGCLAGMSCLSKGGLREPITCRGPAGGAGQQGTRTGDVGNRGRHNGCWWTRMHGQAHRPKRQRRGPWGIRYMEAAWRGMRLRSRQES